MQSIFQAYKEGRLDLALKLGIVKPSVIEYLKIYEVYAMHRNVGKSYSEAVRDSAEQIPVSEITVKRAISQVI